MATPLPQSSNRYIFVESELTSVLGQKKTFRLELGDDGKTKACAFFDIDGTLADLRFLHEEAIRQLFPEADPYELSEVYFAGFKLGNSFREFDRMHGIYREKRNEWKNPEVYRQERLLPKKEEIDRPGSELHTRAAEYAQCYSTAAAEVASRIHQRSPERFWEAKARPIFRLAEAYEKLAVPLSGITANGRDFALAVVKYIGLWELFLDVATDETTEGGGKEVGIAYLLKRFEGRGVPIARDRLIIVGDSLRGDVGSGTHLRELGAKVVGVLVLRDRDELKKIRGDIERDAELKSLTSRIKTRVMFADEAVLPEADTGVYL